MATQRPALDEMLALLRAGDTVIVSRLNRLGRSRNHLIDLVSEFAERNIVFKALDLGIDSSTVAGKLVLRIFSALADYERETILEKTRAGQLLAKANGKHIGRFKGPNPDNYALTAPSASMSRVCSRDLVNPRVPAHPCAYCRAYFRSTHLGRTSNFFQKDNHRCGSWTYFFYGDSCLNP